MYNSGPKQENFAIYDYILLYTTLVVSVGANQSIFYFTNFRPEGREKSLGFAMYVSLAAVKHHTDHVCLGATPALDT